MVKRDSVPSCPNCDPGTGAVGLDIIWNDCRRRQQQEAVLPQSPISPSGTERDALFKVFGRAFFKRDLDLMYQAVTADFIWATHAADGTVTALRTREAIETHFIDQAKNVEAVRFEDVVYHHAPDATFMTFRMSHTDKTSGRTIAEIGVERYAFRDGRIAIKDVYRKLA
jgi:ketosteroid isomerase-like protein